MYSVVRSLSMLTVILFLVGACCATPADDAALIHSPDDPAVATAGWESHPGADWLGGEAAPRPRVGTATTAGSEVLGPAERRAELESLRTSNKRLMDQVTRLTSEVGVISAGGTRAVAEAAVLAPEMAPTPEVQAPPAFNASVVREALRNTAAEDLVVGTNSQGEVYLRVAGSTCFASGKAEVMAAAQSKLRSAFGVLLGRYPALQVRVEGHTDNDPIKHSKWTSNQALSEARAVAVGKFLLGKTALTAPRMLTRGFGSTFPVAGNDTKAGKAQNRRIELVLTP